MAKFVWVASYPRSGGTWLRLLIARLLMKPAESAAELDRLVPSLHRGVRAEHLAGEGLRFIETHWAWRPDLPLREDVIGAIYILRNPLDVAGEHVRQRLAVAGARGAGLDPAERTALGTRTLDEFIEHGGDPLWRRQGVDGWNENVRSWLAKSNPLPRLILRYDDLAADTARGAADICRFLKADKPEAEIAAAAEMTVERFREWEAGNAGPAGAAAADAAAGEGVPSPAQREAALARFGPTMRLTGHLPPQAAPST